MSLLRKVRLIYHVLVAIIALKSTLICVAMLRRRVNCFLRVGIATVEIRFS
jgi:hypothetical protein